MPKLVPTTKGQAQPVHVQMDDGSFLYKGKKRAEFTLAEGRRVSCDPVRAAAWQKQKGHSRVAEKPAKS